MTYLKKYAFRHLKFNSIKYVINVKIALNVEIIIKWWINK